MEEVEPSGSAAQPEQAIVPADSSEGSGITPQLQNIVATVNLGVKLDLKNVALHARNAEYNPKVLCLSSGCPSMPELASYVLQLRYFPALYINVLSESLNPGLLCLQRFSAVIMRIRDPKTTALMFASGKVVGFS